MAAEAVYKVKETEETGKEIVRQADEEAKRVITRAKIAGETKKKAILEDAAQQSARMMREAVERANRSCETIIARGAAEREKLLSPDAAKLENAVKLVVERIVSVNGNR